MIGGNGMILWLRQCSRGSIFRSKSKRLRERRLGNVRLIRFGEVGGVGNPVFQPLLGDRDKELDSEAAIGRFWCLYDPEGMIALSDNI